ncbi:MAG: pyruvate dehydrogenase (acetyl-transferring), homodimeric type, partial [Gammaproteobacteria bacterium]
AVPLLEERGCSVDVWSVTSFNELQRDGLACERWNRLHPEAPPRSPYLCQVLAGESGAFVAVSDYMRVYAGAIAPWVPGEFSALGTDGYGVSDTREALRRYFEVDPPHIVLAALDGLRRGGAATSAEMAAVIRDFGIDADAPAAAER